MHDNITFALAFLLGLSSSLHCIGMCGGIINALSMSLSQQTESRPLRLFILICAYNFGRIGSYSLAGAVVGYLAYLSPLSSMSNSAYIILQSAAAAFLVALGLHVAGWFPQVKKIEAAGLYLWKYLQPLGKRFIPANTIPRAIMVGMVWGWLPCGLVYSVLLWTLSSIDAFKGAMYMFMFGLGTLPSMVATGLVGSSIMKISSQLKFRKIAGLLIILLGLTSPFLQFTLFDSTEEGSQSTEHSHH